MSHDTTSHVDVELQVEEGRHRNRSIMDVVPALVKMKTINHPLSASHVQGAGMFDFIGSHKHYTAHHSARLCRDPKRMAYEEAQMTDWEQRRKWLGDVVEAHTTQMIVLVLLFLDVCALVIEFMIEFGVIGPGEEHDEEGDDSHDAHADEHSTSGFDWHSLEEGLGVMSLVILLIFLVEISCLLFAFGWEFFRHKLYVLDLCVVTTSLIFWFVPHDGGSAEQFLLILRLWRGVRIAHGVGTAAEKEYHELKEQEEAEEAFIAGLERRIKELTNVNASLREQLEDAQADLKDSNELSGPQFSHTLSMKNANNEVPETEQGEDVASDDEELPTLDDVMHDVH